MAWTREDGWVWVFANVDHRSAETWTPDPKTGDRIAALQPVYDAVIYRFGGLSPGVARGIQLRHDWGTPIPVQTLHRIDRLARHRRRRRLHRRNPKPTAAPKGSSARSQNNAWWSELHDTVDDLRQAVRAWTELYNNEWLIQHQGHQTSREAFTSGHTEVTA